MIYKPNVDEISRFQKAYVGVVENPGLTYSMKDILHGEGYFLIKVTPLGANLCMLEDLEEGEMEALL